MATQCWYCGKSISRLRRLAGGIHPECKKEYEANLKRFGGALVEAATSGEVIEEAEVKKLDALVSEGQIREKDRRQIGLAVYQMLHRQALYEGYLAAGERNQLRSLQSYISLNDKEAKVEELDRLRRLHS